MDVNTNNLGTRNYQPSEYASGAVPSSGDGGEQDQVIQPKHRARLPGDSLGDSLSSPLPRRAPQNKTGPAVDPHKKLLGLQVARFAAFALAAVSAFIFGVMVLQPILLPIFSLGTCFSCGVQEWAEFSVTALKISTIPLVISLVSAACAWYATREFNALSERIDSIESRGLSALPR